MNPAFLLTSNDNPGNLITHVQLKETNYDEWARAVENGLTAKKKLGFINGTLEKPKEGDESPSLDDWTAVNAMVKGWIMTTIEPSLRLTISHASTATELWKELRDRFHVTNGPRVQQLRAELSNLKQKGMTVVSYYGKLKHIWDELNDYDPLPECKCGAIDQFVKKREEEQVHQFLLGLDDDMFRIIRSTILSAEPLPTLGRAYAKVCQEERMSTMEKEKAGK